MARGDYYHDDHNDDYQNNVDYYPDDYYDDYSGNLAAKTSICPGAGETGGLKP